MENHEEYRCGYVALIGKPNVGKSTLLNALLGQKLSIVTRKPQTTRNRVLGILTEGNMQIILLDTPGVIDPRYGLQRSMMKDVKRALGDADLVLFLADAGTDRIDSKTLEYLSEIPTILVLNKMDLVASETMLPRVEKYLEEYKFEEIIPISALKKEESGCLAECDSGAAPYRTADVSRGNDFRASGAIFCRGDDSRKSLLNDQTGSPVFHTSRHRWIRRTAG